MKKRTLSLWIAILFVGLLSSCTKPIQKVAIATLDLYPYVRSLTAAEMTSAPSTATPEPTIMLTPTAQYEALLEFVPTHPQDTFTEIPALRTYPISHEVTEGDTLTNLALIYQVPRRAIITENSLQNPDMIRLGSKLIIPPQIADVQDSAEQVFPDILIVNGPACEGFSVSEYLKSYPNSYLNHYLESTPTPAPQSEIVQSVGRARTGAEIITQISMQTSVSPKVLLTLLEFQSQSVTGTAPNDSKRGREIADIGTAGGSLAAQLTWAANTLNYGYYQWKQNRINLWILEDDTVIAVNSQTNAGSAALRYLFSQVYGLSDWQFSVSPNGFARIYAELFGEWDELEMIWENTPPDFPDLALPFAAGEVWSFTSGPHNAWTNGMPWGALDFAPPDTLGCNRSDYWVNAVTDGTIVYSNAGLILQSLDLSGSFRSGWTLVYLHLESRGRVPSGEDVKRGDGLGHPSCEGGISNGTHVHFARRYNGEWLPINAQYPLSLSGWEAYSAGKNYDGYLMKEGMIAEAWFFKTAESEISY